MTVSVVSVMTLVTMVVGVIVAAIMETGATISTASFKHRFSISLQLMSDLPVDKLQEGVFIHLVIEVV